MTDVPSSNEVPGFRSVQEMPAWMRLRAVPLGNDDALRVAVGVWRARDRAASVVLSEGAVGALQRPVLTRYFEHVANQLRWQLPWLAGGPTPGEPVWYQWEPGSIRAGVRWPARLSRVVLAEYQGVYRYASWRAADAPWEAELTEALCPRAWPASTPP